MDDFTQLQAAADQLADAVKHVAGSAPIAISVAGRTSQGVGTVGVSVGGRLQDVDLKPAAMELPPDRLAAAIQAAYTAACRDATEQARRLIANATRDHPQFGGFFDELLPDADQSAEQPDLQDADTDDEDDWPTIRG